MKLIQYCFALLLPLLLSACATYSHDNHDTKAKPPGQLRVATYNVNWGEEMHVNSHPKKTIATIKATKADIVLLQEVTIFWEKLINKTLNKTYRYRRFYHYPNSGGLAVLSHYPFKTLNYLRPIEGWHPIWILKSKTPLGEIQLINVHLTPPVTAEGSIGMLGHAIITSPRTRLNEVKYIHDTLMKQQQYPTIIAGDFNENGGGLAGNYLKRIDFYDAWKISKKKHYTWKWPMGPITFRGRYDRFYFSRPLKLTNLQVLHKGVSDHFPVIADFTMQ